MISPLAILEGSDRSQARKMMARLVGLWLSFAVVAAGGLCGADAPAAPSPAPRAAPSPAPRAAPGRAEGEPRRLVLEVDLLYSGDGPARRDQAIRIEGGVIRAVGPAASVPGAERIRFPGAAAVPGLVAVPSTIGLERSDLRTGGSAALRAIDALRRTDPAIPEVLRHGVTTAAAIPRGRGTFAGLSSVLKPPARTGSDPRILAEEGPLFASIDAGGPSTTADRLRAYYALRDALRGARRYGEAWEKYAKDLAAWKRKKKAAAKEAPKDAEPGGAKKSRPAPAKKSAPAKKTAPAPAKKAPPPAAKKAPPGAKKAPPPPKRPRLEPDKEALLAVLRRERAIVVEARRADAIRLAARLFETFHLRGAILGADEARRAIEPLARARVPVILGPLHPEPDAFPRPDPRAAGALASRDIPVAITAGNGSALAPRLLLLEAAAAVSGGLDRAAAIAAVTARPAEILGLGERIGRIAPGRDADIVILSGDPFDGGARVLAVFVDGVRVTAPGETEL